MKSVTINENDGGQRLDKFMGKYFKGAMPNALIYKSIRKGRVKVNGKKSDFRYMLCRGDIVELYINDNFFDDIKTAPKR